MAFNIDFGIHESALKYHALRHDLISSNLANADTPGFKAKDVDFQSFLNALQEDPSDVAGREDPFVVQYRTASAPALDGNTVDAQMEKTEFSKNTMQYLASLQFLNQKIGRIMSALKGD